MTEVLSAPPVEAESDSDASADLVTDPPTVLGDRYRLDRLIGSGGMGAVYEGCDLHTGGAVAVKVLHRGFAPNNEVFNRFRAEAAIIDRLQHRNIARVRDFHDPYSEHGRKSDPAYIVLELLKGENLHERIKKQGPLRNAEPHRISELLELARQVGGALQAAHEKSIVHRDIKPANIFLVKETTAYGEVEVVKLLDFGIAKATRVIKGETRAQEILGTPNYMAPESIELGSGAADARADQWALAATLYEAIAGQQAYPGDKFHDVLHRIASGQEPVPLRALAPGLPPHIYSAIARAMSTNPADRFSSVSQFIQALDGKAPEPLHAAAGPDVRPRRSGAPTVHADPEALLMPAGKSLPDAKTMHSLGGGALPIRGEAALAQVSAAVVADSSVPASAVPRTGQARWALRMVLGLLAVAGLCVLIWMAFMRSRPAKDPIATIPSGPPATPVPADSLGRQPAPVPLAAPLGAAESGPSKPESEMEPAPAARATPAPSLEPAAVRRRTESTKKPATHRGPARPPAALSPSAPQAPRSSAPADGGVPPPAVAPPVGPLPEGRGEVPLIR